MLGFCNSEQTFGTSFHASPFIFSPRYLAPYATVELAILLKDQGDVAQASALLEAAK